MRQRRIKMVPHCKNFSIFGLPTKNWGIQNYLLPDFWTMGKLYHNLILICNGNSAPFVCMVEVIHLMMTSVYNTFNYGTFCYYAAKPSCVTNENLHKETCYFVFVSYLAWVTWHQINNIHMWEVWIFTIYNNRENIHIIYGIQNALLNS
jgi:hypothetical protein